MSSFGPELGLKVGMHVESTLFLYIFQMPLNTCKQGNFDLSFLLQKINVV